MENRLKNNINKGFSLFEVILATAVLAMFITGIIGIVIYMKETVQINEQHNQAILIAEESLEAVQNMRDESFMHIQEGVYGLYSVDNKWFLKNGPDVVDEFLRQISIDKVTNKMYDITVTITWDSIIEKENTVELSTTLTNWGGFEWGGLEGTEIGLESWCNPVLTSTEIDLAKNAEVENLIIQDNRILAAAADRPSGISMTDIIITEDYPPQLSVQGSFEGYKINDFTTDWEYIYIATDTNDEEVTILDIDTYERVGYFNAPTDNNGDHIYVRDGIGFLIARTDLFAFDLSEKTGERELLGEVDLEGNGRDLEINGNYAYIPVNGGSYEFKIVDITDPENMYISAYADLNRGSGQNVAVHPSGNRAYAVTTRIGNQDEFFVIDTTSKTGELSVLESYDTGDMQPWNVELVPGKLIIVVGENGEEIQVLDIRDEYYIQRCGGLDLEDEVWRSFSVVNNDNAYTYILTSDIDAELKVIEGGSVIGSEILQGESPGNGDWCNPLASISSHDIPGESIRSTIIGVPNQLYLGTDSGYDSLMKVIYDDQIPPEISVEGEFDGYEVNDIFVEGDYAYLATTENYKEVVIVDISSYPYTEVGYYNASGWDDGNGIYVVGDVGYLAQGRRVYSFDLSSKEGSRSTMDILNVGIWFSYVTNIEVVGDYAYVSLYNDWDELAVIDVSNPYYMSEVANADVNYEQVYDIEVSADGTKVFFGTDENSGDEFFIIDTTEKTGNRPVIASYDTNGMSVYGISVIDDRVILVGSGGVEYQVLDIYEPESPVYCGGAEFDYGVRDVVSIIDGDDAFSYIVTGDDGGELKVIEGGESVGPQTTGFYLFRQE